MSNHHYPSSYDDYFINCKYSDGQQTVIEKRLIRPDRRLQTALAERTNLLSPHIVKIEAVQMTKDGNLQVRMENYQYSLGEYLDAPIKLEMSTACQLINDMIQGLKDMLHLGLIYLPAAPRSTPSLADASMRKLSLIDSKPSDLCYL